MVINDSLLAELGPNAAVVLTEINNFNIDSNSEFMNIKGENYVCCTKEYLKKKFFLSRFQLDTIIQKLDKYKLLKYKVAGNPAKSYFHITEKLKTLV